MRPFPTPLIPAPGSIQNIQVNSNIVTNVGTWPIYPPIKPASKQIIMVNMFVLAAIVHLFSIGGFIQTTSLYPGAPTPVPAPGIISWTGYLIPPAIPIPNINFPSEDGSEPPVIEQPDGSSITDPIPEPEVDINDLLGGNVAFDNVVDSTLPEDVIDEVGEEDINEILSDFKEQIKIGGTKCE